LELRVSAHTTFAALHSRGSASRRARRTEFARAEGGGDDDDDAVSADSLILRWVSRDEA
jgi:hypothetical protein